MNDQDMLSGLPVGVRALLASPPLAEPRLLELAARWEGLPPAQARMAEALRLFVVTWDPLEWLVPRPQAVATANAWPLELVVYVPVWSLAEAGLADGTRAKIAEQVARWPDDVQTRTLAGDALALLGDADAAPAQYQAALPLARQANDFRATRELSAKIFRLTHPGRAQPAVQRRQPRSKPSRSQRKGKR
jgi:hypothetical protein